MNSIYEEINDINNKISQGIQTMRQMKKVRVGFSEKEEVFSSDKIKLYHYKSLNDKVKSTPVLVVYALVNRYYMADLDEKRSLIRGMLEKGLDVYLVDWGYPDQGDRYLDLDDYINGYMNDCVDFIRKENGLDSINLLGICQGGTMSLCYTSIYPKKVKNLVTMVTPVDFHTKENLLSHLARKIDVDKTIDALGNIKGEILNSNFASMMPITLNFYKYFKSLDSLQDEQSAEFFFRMEKWINDSPDQPGEALRQFVKEFFQQNKLIKGEIKIGEDAVDLKKITQPILNVFGTEDHIVPPSASVALENKTASKDYTELPVRTGHIGMYVSGKTLKLVPASVSDWILERE